MRNRRLQAGAKRGTGALAIAALLTAFTSPFELINAQGINTTGINATGINAQGIHADGINKQGINAQGINTQGINKQGINAQGINTQGINTQGINPTGISGQGIQNGGNQSGGGDSSTPPAKSPSTPEPRKPAPPKPGPTQPEPPKPVPPKPQQPDPEPPKPEPKKPDTETPPKKEEKIPAHRSKEAYQKVLDMPKFDVTKSYLPDKYTYCNIFTRDVMKEMGADMPQKLANDLYGWFQTAQAKKQGWREVTAEEAQRLANQGMPTVASWKNTKGYHGHIAPVIPYAKGEKFNPNDVAGSVVVKNAGAKNYNYTTLSQSFGKSRVPEIKFFVYEK
ncbi:hypothetical protein KDJ56_07510 [Brevibacillus composti]|uniref:CHAP domain-containing protein n=1 Tax=Brevibacillus composti TaxID=2796470 RepID=A0A7T5ENE8_9BACL|nr:hypothetical protein [Brevibacillus composti]QQE75772.1 hypothetical protein JD108_07830 [Brevibacillus composti]QUO42798.1 hypothetical protein KDJ56_07510 [Brevibacillus composti]